MHTARLEYDTMLGEIISPRFQGMNLPVPTEEVRERAGVPTKYAYASLSDKLAEGFQNLTLLETGQQYVATWPDNELNGRGMLIAGPTGCGKTFLAAAVLNEIHMKWGQMVPVTSAWLSMLWGLQTLLDLRHFKQEEQYKDLMRKYKQCNILVMDDLLHVGEYAQAKQLVMSIYEYREQYRLPTLVTMNAALTKDDWSPVARVFNQPFMRRLRDNAAGFTVTLL